MSRRDPEYLLTHYITPSVRTWLIHEREQLVTEAQAIQTRLDRIEWLLELCDAHLPKAVLGGTPAGANRGSLELERAQLRSTIVAECKTIHPEGITSDDLVSKCFNGSITPRRVTRLCQHSRELITDGEKWYWVPPELEEYDDDAE